MNSAGESLGTYGAIIVGDITSPPLFPLRTSIAALSNVVISWNVPVSLGCLPIRYYIINRNGVDLIT